MLLRCLCGYSWLNLRKPNFTASFGSGVCKVLGLVVSTAIEFTIAGNSLDKDRFLVPNLLKKVLCITPLLLLLLLKTAEDVENHIELVVLPNGFGSL